MLLSDKPTGYKTEAGAGSRMPWRRASDAVEACLGCRTQKTSDFESFDGSRSRETPRIMGSGACAGWNTRKRAREGSESVPRMPCPVPRMPYLAALIQACSEVAFARVLGVTLGFISLAPHLLLADVA